MSETNTLDVTPDLCLVRSVPGVEDESLVELNGQIADHLELSTRIFNRHVSEIDRNPALTAIGKAEAKRASAKQAAENFVMIQSKRDNLANAIERTTILAPQERQRIPQGVNADDWRGLEREIREKADRMSQEDRDALYLSAAANGDTLTVRALELAPASFRLIAEETIAKGAELYAARVYPEQYAQFEARRVVLSSIDTNYEMAKQQLARRVSGALAAFAA